MASASPRALSRLLLQRSDRHPIGCIDGTDLEPFDQRRVREALSLGVLVQREDLVDADGLIFQQVNGRTIGFGAAPHLPAVQVEAEQLLRYDIDFVALCRAIRSQFRLEGAPVQALRHNVCWLGASGRGSRRTAYFVARAVTERNGWDLGVGAKVWSGAASAVLLTPTDRHLPDDLLRRLGAERIQVRSLESSLADDPPNLFATNFHFPSDHVQTPSPNARLRVDVEGRRVLLDDRELTLTPREFAVLQLLASELIEQGGFVSRGTISDTIRAVTGNDDTNDEQVDKVISSLRKRFKPENPFEVKRGIGARLVFAASDVALY